MKREGDYIKHPPPTLLYVESFSSINIHLACVCSVSYTLCLYSLSRTHMHITYLFRCAKSPRFFRLVIGSDVCLPRIDMHICQNSQSMLQTWWERFGNIPKGAKIFPSMAQTTLQLNLIRRESMRPTHLKSLEYVKTINKWVIGFYWGILIGDFRL